MILAQIGTTLLAAISKLRAFYVYKNTWTIPYNSVYTAQWRSDCATGEVTVPLRGIYGIIRYIAQPTRDGWHLDSTCPHT
jgi:hypothetical protein